ncbi:tRNA-Thr(GGU) m(6)t(6)A37 methyltransferase TsaA [Halalkaliarchaeum desulfuricum]|uniref:tRNA-Thr(GGU) m(6)t(6)A37 methyltransferase TsaA n=1 Tax=Halalkaliarchaeum desulfuricum TaxID=2055893 RepID=A0A343TGB6_9EURY|nr:tRNA (N6-threonylcarbamoyladenosine(37)-N6)-methyltransferase TrmO [Halalkaliarchaeum desulfuricum]AUX08138.1 tRNA-Thr(GGU) m(6)t(6)A37 methyltransferase TsaA [Halalkaliarchaeum desulfuricum]
MEPVTYDPIGVVESPFSKPEEVPRPSDEFVDATGTVHLKPEYEAGLKGLEEFSHVVLVSHLHEVAETRLRVTPIASRGEVGIFATSGTVRPNPIGTSVVELVELSGTELTVSNLDLADGTPILDIKPYAPKMTDLDDLEIGWMGD